VEVLVMDMDETIEYIEMCKQAKEIQKLWHFKDGDYLYDINSDRPRVQCWAGYSASDFPGYPQDGIWLPRQDQLQQMFTLNEMSKQFTHEDGQYPLTNNILVKSVNFNGFVEKNWEHFDSFEKHWLAFVMKIKFSKRWVGKNWVMP